ncbi:MAG: hypothetical protein J6A53_05860 [Clostridia bacterium]|nr:hypothetical protein [Clostridia bacterium]
MDNYIKEYCGNFEFDFVEHISSKIADISINIDAYEAQKNIDGIIHSREKALVNLTKNNLKYQCELFEEHNYENSFFKVMLNGHSYLFFRKTLYGFTLLDTETMCEFYNYVPQAIKTGEESFIITDVKQIGEIFVLDGCYWACPYQCFAYDFKSKLFVNVSHYLGIISLNDSTVKDNKLILNGRNSNNDGVTKEFMREELAKLISKNGLCEI